MLGYLFYTASDYYGIHTVFYTPLIIALSSTGATVHKGLLRIVGCIIGGALGLICSIWVIPRFETLETFFLIVFCVHGLAAWIAFGSERISYVGLQIALAFDLGFPSKGTGHRLTLTRFGTDLSALSLASASSRSFSLWFGRKALTRVPASDLALASARSLVCYT